MSQLAVFFEQADLSLASYANLSANFTREDAIPALRDVGMSSKQAEAFANSYSIVDQYRNALGLSATVFQDDIGKRFLAIRGTDSIGDLVADAYILGGWPRFLNAQFGFLWQQVDIWISSGVLPQSFTVSGHSLGGYLAAGIASAFSTHVDGVYLFNAPGTWSLGGNVLASLNTALGLTTPPASNVFNIRAAPGISVAAALGLQPGPPIFIESEANTNPFEPLGNHAIAPLTDALAIYSIFSKLESEGTAGTIEKIGAILKTSSRDSSATLEAALDSLRALFPDPENNTATDPRDRDQFFEHLGALEESIVTYEGELTVETLTDLDAGEIVELAQGDDGIAYRYALTELNAFAILDPEGLGLYSRFIDGPDGGVLDLYDATEGTGTLTEAYLNDRAELLTLKNLDFSNDGNITLRGGRIETIQFIDFSQTDALMGGELIITVRGRQDSAVTNPAKVVFGSDEAESFVGSELAAGDRFYGGGGADTLEGAGGNDYLEGGEGYDTYVWNTGDGMDTILDVDGLGSLVVNGHTVSGGVQIAGNDYKGPGNHLLHFDGDLVSGGVLIVDGQLRIEDFTNGDFGIVLAGAGNPSEVQPTLNDFTNLNRDFGTAAADRFVATGLDTIFVAKGGNDLLLVSDGALGPRLVAGSGSDLVLGGAHEGAADLIGEAGSDVLVGGPGIEFLAGDFFGFDLYDYGFLGGSFSYDQSAFDENGNFFRYGWFVTPHDISQFEETLNFASYFDALTYILGIDESTDLSTHYDDFLDGGGGSDELWGGYGSDVIFGGPGADLIYGDRFTLRIQQVFPEDFFLNGPEWANIVATAFGNPGDDYLDGGDGNDRIWDQEGGNDVLIGGEGNDELLSIDLNSTYAGTSNWLYGDAGNDLLSSRNDLPGGFNCLNGGSGDDVLRATGGDAILIGGAGSDRYVYQALGGKIVIDAFDSAPSTETLHLAFPRIIDPNVDLTISRDQSNLYLGFSGIRDRITILDWFEGNDHKLDQIIFADWFPPQSDQVGEGVAPPSNSYGVAAIEARFTTPTSGEDQLWGTAAHDHLHGGGGHDDLLGDMGNDTLAGDRGNDSLDGGGGADTYWFDLGDGLDHVFDSGGDDDDVIVFGPGITPGMLKLGVGSQTISVGSGGDAIKLVGFEPSRVLQTSTIELFKFDDGTIFTIYDLLALGFDIPGTDANDLLVGTSVDDRISGLDGNDVLNGAAGNDHLDGAGGDDNISGGRGRDTLDGGAGQDTMDGGPSDDVYVVDGAGDIVQEEQDAGDDLVRSTISYVLPLHVENLTLRGSSDIAGTGNAEANVLTGNAGSNALRGNAGDDSLIGADGNDFLDGGSGADVLAGGRGDDTYIVAAADVVLEEADAGLDVMRTGATRGPLPSNVENLVLTGTGDVDGTGNELANYIAGNSGNNVLNGGGGPDSLAGAGGNDTYLVGAADMVHEDADAGLDVIRTAASRGPLSPNVENLVLTGGGDIDGTGNELANFITGNSGSNVLDGDGGADTLAGGDGNDTYIAGAADTVMESPHAGVDVIRTAVNRGALSPNVENLILMGTGNIDGTGNELANSITGNSGSNVLDGGGGADTLAGGNGNDSYIVDATDHVIESGDAGLDTMHTTVTRTPLEANFESLVLTGTGNINGIGNALANSITGNSGNNILDGGAGSDTMTGGAGNDTYIVDTGNDLVVESGGGIDTVRASVTEELAAGVENLVLTGTGAINGTGNTLANALTGNATDNVLNGKSGADMLKGLGGNDTLVWTGMEDSYDGGGGFDTLKVTGGNLKLTVVPNAAIKNVEQIDLTVPGNNRLTLDASDVLDLSLSTNTIKVLGAAGDSVDIVGVFRFRGVTGDFRTYKVGTGTLLVDTDITTVV